MKMIARQVLPLLASIMVLCIGCSSGSDSDESDCRSGQCSSEDTTGGGDTSLTDPEDSAQPTPDLASEPDVAAGQDQFVGDSTEPLEDITVQEEIAPVVDLIADEASESNLVVIPLSDLSTTAKFYTHQVGKVATVKYFAVLDSNGGAHVAFDACDICYGSKKGYSQSGSNMVCNNCGNAFAITGIGTENRAGGCWPGYLEVTITDTEILIDPEALDAGAWYFQ